MQVYLGNDAVFLLARSLSMSIQGQRRDRKMTGVWKTQYLSLMKLGSPSDDYAFIRMMKKLSFTTKCLHYEIINLDFLQNLEN